MEYIKTSREMAEALIVALDEFCNEYHDDFCSRFGNNIPEIKTFKEAGIMTMDEGFVIRTDVREFQITVTSRPRI
jgi:hypothetical protein